MNQATPKRALIVKLGAIGDVLMVVPAAYALHREGYAIDWIVSGSIAPLIRVYPWINGIEADERALMRGTPGERIKAMAGVWRRTAGRTYDLCATIYYDKRYRLLTWAVRAKRRVQLKPGHRGLSVVQGRHYTDEYARILLSRADNEAPFQLAPVRPERAEEPAVPRTDGIRRVAIVPGGARNLLRDNPLRRWPIERYVALAAELRRRGCEVILVGGPEDRWVCDRFHSIEAIDAIGRYSLVETVGLLDSADVTVTHDTGPLHLAGITSTAIVAIFGPTRPHSFMPQRENCVALWGGEGFACRPCYDGSDFAPCTNNGCMQQVTEPMVLGEIERMLEAKRTGTSLPPRVVLPEHTPLYAIEAS